MHFWRQISILVQLAASAPRSSPRPAACPPACPCQNVPHTKLQGLISISSHPLRCAALLSQNKVRVFHLITENVWEQTGMRNWWGQLCFYYDNLADDKTGQRVRIEIATLSRHQKRMLGGARVGQHGYLHPLNPTNFFSPAAGWLGLAWLGLRRGGVMRRSPALPPPSLRCRDQLQYMPLWS